MVPVCLQYISDTCAWLFLVPIRKLRNLSNFRNDKSVFSAIRLPTNHDLQLGFKFKFQTRPTVNTSSLPSTPRDDNSVPFSRLPHWACSAHTLLLRWVQCTATTVSNTHSAVYASAMHENPEHLQYMHGMTGAPRKDMWWLQTTSSIPQTI